MLKLFLQSPTGIYFASVPFASPSVAHVRPSTPAASMPTRPLDPSWAMLSARPRVAHTAGKNKRERESDSPVNYHIERIFILFCYFVSFLIIAAHVNTAVHAPRLAWRSRDCSDVSGRAIPSQKAARICTCSKRSPCEFDTRRHNHNDWALSERNRRGMGSCDGEAFQLPVTHLAFWFPKFGAYKIQRIIYIVDNDKNPKQKKTREKLPKWFS